MSVNIGVFEDCFGLEVLLRRDFCLNNPMLKLCEFDLESSFPVTPRDSKLQIQADIPLMFVYMLQLESYAWHMWHMDNIQKNCRQRSWNQEGFRMVSECLTYILCNPSGVSVEFLNNVEQLIGHRNSITQALLIRRFLLFSWKSWLYGSKERGLEWEWGRQIDQQGRFVSHLHLAGCTN